MERKNSFGGKKPENLIDSFSLNYWQIFDIPLFGRDMQQVLKVVDGWMDFEAKRKSTSLGRRRPRWIATVNPEFVMATFAKATVAEKAGRNDFLEVLKKTDLNVVDGVGLIWAKKVSQKFSNSNFKFSKILYGLKTGGEILRGKYREEVVTGADLMLELCKLAAKKRYKVFFLGGFGDRAERTAKNFLRQWRTNLQCEWNSGEPSISNKEVLKKINEFKPDILFVAYGMKKQEEWIDQNLDKLEVGVVMGVGRSFDYYSGDLKRAPMVWRKMGLEWFYSLIREPKRFKRQLELPKFVWRVLTCG